jgi:hypothetical protein
MLRDLTSLTLSHNKLSTADEIAHLADCKTLSVVDLSYNYLDDPDIVEVSNFIFTVLYDNFYLLISYINFIIYRYAIQL